MKTPDRCRTGTPPSAENGPTGLYFGVSCYRRPTIRASPTTFHTVSEGKFCEVELPHYGVLSSTLAIWPRIISHRFGALQRPLRLFAGRCKRPTRKKSPCKENLQLLEGSF